MSTRSPRKLPQITGFLPEEVTPAVPRLLEICHQLQEEIQTLRDESAGLKGTKAKPPIKPSKLGAGRKTPTNPRTKIEVSTNAARPKCHLS